MATDREKLAMLDRAYALDMGRKVALEVAKHLTTLEVRNLDVEVEQGVREKLALARDAWRECATCIADLLEDADRPAAV